MAQAQATRGDQRFKAAEQEQEQPEAIQYGHVFAVTGDLAVQAIAPRDAAAMRSAEESVPGFPVPQASGGGFSAATAMETAAAYNQAVGAVHSGQASDAATKQGITVILPELRMEFADLGMETRTPAPPRCPISPTSGARHELDAIYGDSVVRLAVAFCQDLKAVAVGVENPNDMASERAKEHGDAIGAEAVGPELTMLLHNCHTAAEGRRRG